MVNGTFDFRTELYRHRLPIYLVAADVGLYLSQLSMYPNGNLLVPHELRERHTAILREHQIGG